VPRIGDYLVEKGLLSENDLKRALEYQEKLKRSNESTPLLGQILIQMGIIDRAVLDQAVTEQIIKLKTALQDANDQLEKRVQERTAELEQALMRLSELNQLKTNFVANISHELRTPLTHLKGYLELLVSHDLGPLEPEQDRAIKTMQRSSERLERLIEDLIMFSLIDRGQVTLKNQLFDLCHICRLACSRSESKAADKQITLTLNCSSEIPSVLGDEEKIYWVLLQLIDNAIKFTDTRGNVDITVSQEGNYVRITIIDNGIGIPADRIEEIFEPFHQLDSGSTRKYGGTGLGLALVRNILEAHGSVIRVTSEPGKGSQFTFLLTTAQE
jgi:signal transduction histidine kinase